MIHSNVQISLPAHLVRRALSHSRRVEHGLAPHERTRRLRRPGLDLPEPALLRRSRGLGGALGVRRRARAVRHVRDRGRQRRGDARACRRPAGRGRPGPVASVVPHGREARTHILERFPEAGCRRLLGEVAGGVP